MLLEMLTDFVCLYTYEFWLSLCKIVRSSVILLLPLFGRFDLRILITLLVSSNTSYGIAVPINISGWNVVLFH